MSCGRQCRGSQLFHNASLFAFGVMFDCYITHRELSVSSSGDAMSSLEPVNIQRLVRDNKQRADASEYSKFISTGSIVSAWHEKHDRSGVKGCLSCSPTAASAATATLTTSTSSTQQHSTAGSTSSCIQEEMKLATQSLLQARRQRLEKLFRQERLQHEYELQTLGLALVKQRN